MAISDTRVIVGAPQDDAGTSDAGSAYVYNLSGATPTVPVATLNNPVPSASDYFGAAVAISGTLVIVGAPNDPTGTSVAGTAYEYDLASFTPTIPVATLNNPSPAAGDCFGRSIAIGGTNVVIGAPYDDSVMLDKGYAYIFGPSTVDGDGDGLLDSWELTYWPSTTGHGPLDDFDHDGKVELLELALGLNPTIADPGGLPPLTIEGGYLTMTISKHPGVTYQVQSAGTLLPALPNSFSASTTTVLMNNSATLKVRDNVLVGAAPTRFMRMQVTTAP